MSPVTKVPEGWEYVTRIAETAYGVIQGCTYKAVGITNVDGKSYLRLDGFLDFNFGVNNFAPANGHKHATLIRLWAAGVPIKVYSEEVGCYVDCPNPTWDVNKSYSTGEAVMSYPENVAVRVQELEARLKKLEESW